MEKITAEEFLNDYAIDDLHVFGRHEEHYSLDALLEEYASIKIQEYKERLKEEVQNLNNCQLKPEYLDQLDKARNTISKRHPEWNMMDKYSREQLQYCMADFAKEYLTLKIEQFNDNQTIDQTNL